MRRLLPTARSFLLHSGQAAVLGAVAVLAMAAAPLTPAAATDEAFAVPEAPPVTAVATAAGPVMRMITFQEPVRGYAAPTGTGVRVAAEGSVLRTGYDAGGYGRFIEVQHPNGMSSLYGHLSRIDVATGDAVASGQRIGLVGSTGRSTGPHLHFEVRRGDRQVNPVKVMGHAFAMAVADAG
jgi:multidrug efflux pump subunit AcrA (membrane-fusion protein)